MNSYPKLFYILKEINLFDKTKLVDNINNVLHNKNVTKPEITDWFKKQYLKWFISPTDDQEKEKFVKKHHQVPDDPEWARNTFDYKDFSREHYNELSHTIDFFDQLNDRDLKKIHKIPFPTVRELVKKWDEELAKRMESGVHHFKIGKDVKILEEWPSGYKMVQILSNEARKEEGNLMGHCVGGDTYYDAIIYSLRDEKNYPHVTIELDNEGQILQLQGKQNTPPRQKYAKYVREFVLKHKIPVLGDGEAIGFRLWRGKYYDTVGNEWNEIYKNQIIPWRNERLEQLKSAFLRGNRFINTLSLTQYYLTELPDWMSGLIIEGSFFCDYNDLTTLKNSPRIVEQMFACDHNKITSLEESPEQVNGTFACNNNKLTTLKGLKHISGMLYAGFNELESLESLKSIPISRHHSLYFYHNPIKQVGDLTKLENVGTLNLHHCGLETMVGFPEIVHGTLNVSYNNLKNLDGIPKTVKGNFSIMHQKDHQFTQEEIRKRCNVWYSVFTRGGGG